jgi:single-strand DNA-binding protein
MSLNKVMLIGNVGKDPEVRHLESGVSVVTISIATTERYKDRNGEIKEQTEWHSVVLWRALAEFAEKYIQKGRQLYIEGKLRSRTWDDQNGQKRYVTEVIADTVRLLGRRSDYESQGTNSSVGKPVNTVSEEPIIEQGEGDDLPF